MKAKCLIIAYGSMGKRHAEVVQSLGYDVDVVSKQSIQGKTVYSSLSKVKDWQAYEYFVISTISSSHFSDLEMICEQVDNKKIFVEKPLFMKPEKLSFRSNLIYVGYQLRYLPLLQELYMALRKEKILFVEAYYGRYLPTWRLGKDYRSFYSTCKEQGGGVLRDLSHELDYCLWLFGDLELQSANFGKYSELEMDAEDYAHIVLGNKSGTQINITIDCINKIPERVLKVHTENKSFRLDLLNQVLQIVDKDGNEELRNTQEGHPLDLLTSMHRDILNQNTKFACSYESGSKIVDLIDLIENS